MKKGQARSQGIGSLLDQGGTAAARLLAANGDVNALRTNTLLRKDEWKAFDETVVRVQRQKLAGIADLQSRGLVRNLGGLGVMIDEYERISDMTDAEQSMSGLARSQEDTPDFTLVSVPIPITHKDFRVNIRRLLASRQRGTTIDTYAAEIASRLVAEKLEDVLFNGGITVGGGTVYGYTNFPDRKTGTLAAAWTAASGVQIVDDVLNMIATLENNNYRGPYFLYVPVLYGAELRADYKAESERTYEERLMAIPEIAGIRTSAKLSGGVVLVQMSSDVVDLSVGQDVATVEWSTDGGMSTNFKVMAAMSQRLKSDDGDGTTRQSGIAHYTP